VKTVLTRLSYNKDCCVNMLSTFFNAKKGRKRTDFVWSIKSATLLPTPRLFAFVSTFRFHLYGISSQEWFFQFSNSHCVYVTLCNVCMYISFLLFCRTEMYLPCAFRCSFSLCGIYVWFPIIM
jgi:hypothetical protein